MSIIPGWAWRRSSRPCASGWRPWVGAPSWIAWDVYLFYGPGAEWTDAGLPAPAAALAQAGTGQGGGVVAAIGTLPARGDQTRIPPRLEGLVVMAGTYEELPALLAEVAGRFARE